MEMGKLAALAVTSALCALVVKQRVPELALLLSISAGVLLIWQTLDALTAVRGLMDRLFRTAGLSAGVWKPVVKTVGIGVATRLTASICRDAGEGGLAAALETAGTALALLTTLPLIEQVFRTLEELL